MRIGIDYIGVGVGAVITRSDGKVFLAKRGKAARNERHRWEFPGGSVEFGETLEHAVVREVREEYDFDIIVHRLLDVIDHILPHEHQHWVSSTFLCSYAGGVPRIMEPHKCDQIRWFAVDDIPRELLTSASLKSLADFEEQVAR
jgi:mutator protein MutT